MLIIKIEDGDVSRALKKYKKKVQDTRLLQQLKKRKEYTKPSVRRRNEILKAEYKSKKNISN
ncbi:MAG: 30S ribosomal protein S21 [Chitinophagales bacterium]|nr:30S ribosomal protein S21 [Chitinophagales bacterium]